MSLKIGAGIRLPLKQHLVRAQLMDQLKWRGHTSLLNDMLQSVVCGGTIMKLNATRHTWPEYVAVPWASMHP